MSIRKNMEGKDTGQSKFISTTQTEIYLATPDTVPIILSPLLEYTTISWQMFLSGASQFQQFLVLREFGIITTKTYYRIFRREQSVLS